MDEEIDMMFPQLKSMFPNMDDEIILQVILQNTGNFNKMIDILISFNSVNIVEEEKHQDGNNKELSLFSNVNNNPVKDDMPSRKVIKQDKPKQEILSQNQLAFVNDDNVVKIDNKPNKKSIGQKVSSIDY